MRVNLDNTATGRADASRDLPVKWVWRGWGRTPEPELRFSSVLLNDQKVSLSWSSKGWAGSRVAYICPICKKRSRYLYLLANRTFGCNQHVSKVRVRLEGILYKLRRAERKQRNGKHRAEGRRLRRDAEDELWSLYDY